VERFSSRRVAIGLGLAFAFALSLLAFIAWGGHLN
jgi:hypothetical protein